MNTIQDVAALAGVSVSTVSNVLNGREARMRAETLARVHQAIADLGFRPNQSARMLKTGLMPTIGLMVPSIANPFFGELARWIEAAALAKGYGLLLCNTHRDSEREREYAETLMAQGVKAVIQTSALAAHDHLIPLVARGLAAVSLDRALTADGLNRDFVSVDNRRAGFMAAEHLLALGHRHIIFVGAALQSMNRVARHLGALEACQQAGVQLDRHLGNTGPDYHESEMAELGRLAAHQLHDAKSTATAFIGLNDMVAIGLLAGLKQCGLNVPNDVSVIGIDGISLGAYVSPPLSSVSQPLEAIANAAIEHVLTRVKQPDLPPQESIFPPTLLLRSSTGQAPARR